MGKEKTKLEIENIDINTVVRLFYEMKFDEIKRWLWNQNKIVGIKNFSVYMERAYAFYILNEYIDAFELLNNISKSLDTGKEIVNKCEFNKFRLLQVLCDDSYDKLDVFNDTYKLLECDIERDFMKPYLKKINDYKSIISKYNVELENSIINGYILRCDDISELKIRMKKYWNLTNNTFLMTCEYELDKEEYYRYINNLFSYYAELNYYNLNPVITDLAKIEHFSNKLDNINMSEISIEYFDLFILLNYFKIEEAIQLFNKYKVKKISFLEDISISCIYTNILYYPNNIKKYNMIKVYFYIMSKVNFKEEEMYEFSREITRDITDYIISSKYEFDSIAYFYSQQYTNESINDVYFIIDSLEFLLNRIITDSYFSEVIEDYIKEISLIISMKAEFYFIEETTIRKILFEIRSSGYISARILTFIYKLCNNEMQQLIEIKIKELLYKNEPFWHNDFLLCYYSLINNIIKPNNFIDKKLENFINEAFSSKFEKYTGFYLSLIIKLYTYNKIKDLNIFRKHCNDDGLIEFLADYENFNYNNLNIEWMDLIDSEDFHKKIIEDKARKNIIKEKLKEYIINNNVCNKSIKDIYFKYYNE